VKSDIKTVAAQRAEKSRMVLAAASLELLLRDQIRRAINGDRSAAVEFQQFVQYAPPETRQRMRAYLSKVAKEE